MNYIEERPWGKFENLLETDYCKVKQITVYPKQKLSYQYHEHRAERWVIVQGEAIVTINDFDYTKVIGDAVKIPKGAKHRIWNPGDVNLIFIEVQTGAYFGEDDIIRLEDNYGRV